MKSCNKIINKVYLYLIHETFIVTEPYSENIGIFKKFLYLGIFCQIIRIQNP